MQSDSEDEGEYECDVWEHGEQNDEESAVLSKLNCKKNPEHKAFIPVHDFTLDHLPGRFRDETLFELINVVAKLTVRLKIGFSSPSRDEKDPYRCLGSLVTRTGTGFAMYAKNAPGEIACPCPECVETRKLHHAACNNSTEICEENEIECADTASHSLGGKEVVKVNDETRNVTDVEEDVGATKNAAQFGLLENEECYGQHKWWHFEIMTALHVVFDESEACQTEVDLFYDGDDNIKTATSQSSVPVQCESISHDRRRYYCYGVVDERRNVNMDRIVLTCVTHDEALVKEFRQLRCRLIDLRVKLEDDVFVKEEFLKASPSTLCVIVSHPHGCSKQITIGEWRSHKEKEKYLEGYSLVEERYTADTCPGSSGASVLIVKADPADSQKVVLNIGQSGPGPLHSSGGKKGVNISRGLFYIDPHWEDGYEIDYNYDEDIEWEENQ